MAAHLTADELAARWHMTPAWVRTLALTKQIPGALQVGRHWRFPVAAVEAWEQRNAVRDPLSITDRSAARSTR